MITKRQAKILNRIVEDYIHSAQPISSQFLEKKHDFGICPATIRIEMQKLTNKGFLYQPHTSAGRVPTDKGYRFFVDNLLVHLNFSQKNLSGLEKEFSELEEILKIEEILMKDKENILKLATHLTKFLAELSSNFTILHLLERDFVFKEGWEEILKEPEFEEKDSISDFFEFLENFEKNIKDLKINSEIKIYIGKENPLPRAKNFSIISSRCHFPNEEGVISLLGPKRMDYNKSISLINSLTKFLEDHSEM